MQANLLRMPRSLLRAGLWVVTASAILVFGFAALIFGIYWLGTALGSIDPEHAKEAQIALVFYFQTVGIKGLLPQLLLGLAIFWGLTRAFPKLALTRRGLAAGLALAAALAYGVVAPLLLTASFEGWPALKMRHLSQHIATFLMMTGAVVAACLLPRIVLPSLRLRAGPEP
jgi:hypothetical protein